MYSVDLKTLESDGSVSWVLLAWDLSRVDAMNLVLSALSLHGAESRIRRQVDN